MFPVSLFCIYLTSVVRCRKKQKTSLALGASCRLVLAGRLPSVVRCVFGSVASNLGVAALAVGLEVFASRLAMHLG